MTFGRLRPWPDYPTTPASYPVSVRRIRVYGLGFLQIPPPGGHPCLALRFRSSRPAEDLHLLKTQHAWHTKIKGCRNSLLQQPLQCRGEPRCTFVNEIVGLPLVLSVFPQSYQFGGDAVLELVEPGLYRKC